MIQFPTKANQSDDALVYVAHLATAIETAHRWLTCDYYTNLDRLTKQQANEFQAMLTHMTKVQAGLSLDSERISRHPHAQSYAERTDDPNWNGR